jgi:hypothetical protein
LDTADFLLPKKPTRRAGPALRFPVAAAVCLGILAIALLASSAFLHWFVIPLFACGVLCCLDGIQLFEGKGRNLFDPVPLLGAFGVYFFYVAPLLHVARDYWFISRSFAPTDRPDDWRTWLGWMGFINLLGLLIYRGAHNRFARLAARPGNTRAYTLSRRSVRFYGLLLLVVSAGLQAYIYFRFGGFNSYLDAYAGAAAAQGGGFQGLGWVLCIAESFPLLLLIVAVSLFRTMKRTLTATEVYIMLGLLSVIILLFGGLRGSRSNTVFSVVYAVGIIHAMLRRLSWRFFAALAAGLVLFMYVYGFYKVSRSTFWAALSDPEARAGIAATTGRTIDAVLLGDMERSDIQAYLLFRIVRSGSDFQYAFGETYRDAIVSFIPSAISSYRPPGKLKYGTDAFFGAGTYVPNSFAATKVYGLAGETMLNFGPLGIPAAFFLFGALVGRLRKMWRRLEPWDSRQYILPILSLSCLVMLSCDLDNVIFNLLQHAFVPALMIWWSSRPVRGPRRCIISGLPRPCQVSSELSA